MERRRILALALALWWIPLSAWAQESDLERELAGEEPLVNKPADPRPLRELEISDSARKQIQSGQGTVHLYQLVEEMTDDLISDLRELNDQVVSPMAMRRIAVSPNLSAAFGDFVESTIVSAVANSSNKKIKRCVACGAMRSRIDGNDWVVSLGFTEHDQYVAEAKRLGVQTFLDVRFAFYPGVNIAAMTVEIIRAEDAAVLWSETYRSDSSTAAILRSGDRTQTRSERLSELERKLDARPYYGHILYVGGSYLPYDSEAGSITGMALGYRLYEKFGEDNRWMFGIGAEGFANFSKENALLGSFVGATVHYQLTQPNLNGIIVRTGPTISGFFAGTEGNSAAIEWGIDGVFQFKLGAGLSAMYFVPVKFAGADLGGLGLKGRVLFNW